MVILSIGAIIGVVGRCGSTSRRTALTEWRQYTVNLAGQKTGDKETLYVKKSSLPSGGGKIEDSSSVGEHNFATIWYVLTLIVLVVLALRLFASWVAARTQRMVDSRARH